MGLSYLQIINAEFYVLSNVWLGRYSEEMTQLSFHLVKWKKKEMQEKSEIMNEWILFLIFRCKSFLAWKNILMQVKVYCGEKKN